MKNQKYVWILLKFCEKWLHSKPGRFSIVFKIFLRSFQNRKKMKSSISDIPIIPQTLSINKYRATSAKCIKLDIIRMLIECSLKNLLWRQNFMPLFLRYCCVNLCQYYYLHSGEQRANRLNFQWKTKKLFKFCLKFLNNDCLTSLGGFEWITNFFLVLPFQKLKNSIFEIPLILQSLNINN